MEDPMQPESSGGTRGAELTAQPVFDELYDKYKDAVFSFACYLTRNLGEAEDLFQDAWLRVVKHLPEKVEMKSIKAWIFTIVTNLYRDELRKKRVRRLFLFPKAGTPDLEEAKVSALVGESVSDPAEIANQAQIKREITRAIDRLPERQRRVFVLKEIAGFPQAEISDILGTPIGTVKSLIHRAVKRLQKELSSYNPKGERPKCDAKILSV
ncbi:MAG: sigma-70 family RNA polymerase sigma factor [Candidatus Aminicenantes bacterium]|nr:sigma-70 family RNA polymerase sigma factor [Candidatus Aminicenantes bacterium]